MNRDTSSADLVPRVKAGEPAAIARLISRAEQGTAETRAALSTVYKLAGRAHVVGITGVPGSGKSTLVAKLTEKLRVKGGKVGLGVGEQRPSGGNVGLGPGQPQQRLAPLHDGLRITAAHKP